MTSTGLIGSMYILENYENVTYWILMVMIKNMTTDIIFQKQMIEQQNFFTTSLKMDITN